MPQLKPRTEVNLLMMPDYRRDNPYQSLLADALGKQSVQTRFPQGYRRGLPLRRAVGDQPEAVHILHLHWLSPYLKGRNAFKYAVYAVKLFADLALVRLCGVRVVWTIHNAMPHEAKYPAIERWLRRRVAHLADANIVHSAAALREVESELAVDSNKAVIIPHGHYRDVYGPAIDRAAALRQLDISPEGRIALYFGTLRPYKGLETLLTVWRDVAATVRPSKLVIAGSPFSDEYGRQITELAKACGDSVLLRLEKIPDREVPAFFSAADVVVLPFRKILTSGSMLLAMSYDKPVIAPRLPNVVETLGGADDLLYSVDDPRALGQQIVNALTRDLSDLSTRVRRRCDQLGWDAIGQQTAELCRAVLNRQPLNNLTCSAQASVLLG